MPFALKETFQSEKQGKDIWYRFYTQIGPCLTDKEEERALFNRHDHCLQSMAFRHALCFFDIVELPDDAAGNWDWNKPAEKPKRGRR